MFHRRRRAGAFTLVELLIVIAVVVILLALLLPAIAAVRAASRQAQCASNQIQLWNGWSAANSRDMRRLIRGNQWNARIEAYLGDEKGVLFCPDDTLRNQSSSYGLNAHAWRYGAQDPGRIVLLDYKAMVAVVVGRSVSELRTDWPSLQAPRHFVRENVTFADGHASSYAPNKIDPQFCDYYVRYWRPYADSNIQLTNCTYSGDPIEAIAAAGATTSGSSATSGGGATSSASGGSSSSSGTSTGSDPCSALPGAVMVTVMDNAPQVVEGNGEVVTIDFIVTLTQAVPAAVTVNVAAVPVEAQPGTDYAAALVGDHVAGGVLTFPANTTMQTVGVNVIGDTIAENPPLETFKLAISNPRVGNQTCNNLSISSTGQATGRIMDDDAAPQLWKRGFNLGGSQYVAQDGFIWEDGTQSRLTALGYVQSFYGYGLVELGPATYSPRDFAGTDDDPLYWCGYNAYEDVVSPAYPKLAHTFRIPVPQPGNYKITLSSGGVNPNRGFDIKFPDTPALNFTFYVANDSQVHSESRTLTVSDGVLKIDVWNNGLHTYPNHPWINTLLIEGQECSFANNDTPAVTAGTDQSIGGTPTGTATLQGTAGDGCTPSGYGPFQWRWSVVSSPPGGTATFNPPGSTSYNTDAATKTPTVTFSGNGAYTLRFEATDGNKSGSDDVVISVNDPNATLLARYHFNDAADPGKDASGKGNHASVNGSIYDASEGGGCAANFSGSNYLTVPSGVYSQLTTGATVAFWAKSSTNSGSAQTVAFYASQGTKKFNVHLPYSGTIYFDAVYSGNRINKAASSADWGYNTWCHWAFTKNATTGSMAIYRNGAVWHSGAGMTMSLAGLTNFSIGSQAGSVPYQGKMDDFRIYSRDLGASEVMDLYNGGQNPP